MTRIITNRSLPRGRFNNNSPNGLRGYLEKVRANLCDPHISGEEVVKEYTFVMDDINRTLFRGLSSSNSDTQDVILSAVGGYGRNELNLRSDIDIMLCYRSRLKHSTKKMTEKILYTMWDSGLDVGFCIRSVSECIKLAKEDNKTLTSLIDLRFICGDKSLFFYLNKKIKEKLFKKRGVSRFIRDKLIESEARHKAYGGSVYILEPNIKEGKGGLRDYHTLHWIAKVSAGIDTYGKEEKDYCLSAREYNILKKSLDFIWKVRNHLHYATARKSDQLTFDYQESISSQLGYKGDRHCLPVEKFMGEYYKNADNIYHLSSLGLSRTLRSASGDKNLHSRKKRKSGNGFIYANGVVSTETVNVFTDRPESVMEAFEQCAVHAAALDADTRDLISRNLKTFIRFAESTHISQSFMHIMSSSNSFSALMEMHRLRVLAQFIPEFKHITHRMQHDVYHVYTVDIHSLFAIRELEKLGDGVSTDSNRLLCSIYRDIERPEILKLATLLHDIGKSEGKGHAKKGASIAARICRRIGMAEADIGLVSFLVKNHLVIADTALHRDIHDEKLVLSLAGSIGSEQRLKMLYLLTYADISAVGPHLWTKWKGALLQELYFKSYNVIKGGVCRDFDKRDSSLSITMKEVIEILSDDLDEEKVKGYFDLFPERFIDYNTSEDIAEHLLALEMLSGKPVTIRIKQRPDREYTQVAIYTADIHGLFANITGAIAANNINILGAQIYTLKNGTAVDILQTNSAAGKMVSDEGRWNRVESDINRLLTGQLLIEKLVSKHKPSILDVKPRPYVATTIQIDNQSSSLFTILEIHSQDRIGLLYIISKTITGVGLYISLAKVSTKGDEAVDIFYLKDIFGQKIYDGEKLTVLKIAVQKALGPKIE